MSSTAYAGDPPRARRAPRPARLVRGVLEHVLVLPSTGWTLLFFLIPLGIVVLYSFGTINPLTFKVSFGWTLDNYRQIGSSEYLTPLLRSLGVSLGATLGCLLVGFPTAYLLALQPARRQRLLLLAIMIPFWTSFVIRTYAWVNVLQNGGPLERLLRSLGLVHGPLNFLYTPGAITVGIAADYLPLMILPLYVALERIDPALREAAADLGANGRRTLRRVILPLATPGIVAGCIMVGIPSTGEYVVPAILGGGKTLMFGNVVADQFGVIGNYTFGSALSTVFMAAMTIVLLASRSKLAKNDLVIT